MWTGVTGSPTTRAPLISLGDGDSGVTGIPTFAGGTTPGHSLNGCIIFPVRSVAEAKSKPTLAPWVREVALWHNQSLNVGHPLPWFSAPIIRRRPDENVSITCTEFRPDSPFGPELYSLAFVDRPRSFSLTDRFLICILASSTRFLSSDVHLSDGSGLDADPVCS